MRFVLNTLRIVADWLADGTNGVNAKIDLIDLDGSDSVPSDVAAIINESQSNAAARKLLTQDQTLPVLLLSQAEAVEIAHGVSQGVLDGIVPVLIAYGVKDDDTAAGKEDGYYTMDAVSRSLWNLMDGNEASRTRNGIVLMNIASMSVAPMEEKKGDAYLTAGLIARFQVRDADPK